MATLPTFLDELTFEEGFRNRAYKCSQGFWTVGVGHNLDADGLSPEELKAAISKLYTRDEAMALLRHDVDHHDRLLFGALPWARDLDEVRQRVLRNMCFQMGWGNGRKGLSSFKATLKHIENGAYELAASNLSKSLWAKQTPARAKRMIQRMRTGIYQTPTHPPLERTAK